MRNRSPSLRTAILTASLLSGLPTAAAAGAWSQPGHDASHSGFNASESTISPENVNSLVRKWDFPTGSEVFFPVLDADNTIFALNLANQLFALNPRTGAQLWSFNAGPTIAGGGMAIDSVHRKAFVLCSIDAQHSGVCALDAKTGATLWTWAIYKEGTVDVGSSPYNPPVVKDGLVFVGESDTASFSHVGYFVALNEQDGTLVWSRGNCGNTGHNYCNFIGSNPAAVANGFVIYDTGYEGSPYAAVCAVSESSGMLAWCFPSLQENVDNHAPSVADKLVFLAETDSNANSEFFALSLKTGAVRWSYSVNDGNGANRYFPAAAANGVVYFEAGGSPTIFAFDEKHGGAPTWQTTTPGDTGISVANGVLYGWAQPNLFALDAQTGSPLWDYPTDIRNATPFVENGSLFATCGINDVCAFGLP